MNSWPVTQNVLKHVASAAPNLLQQVSGIRHRIHSFDGQVAHDMSDTKNSSASPKWC